MVDLQPLLIGRFTDVCHRKAQSAQAYKIKSSIATFGSNVIVLTV